MTGDVEQMLSTATFEKGGGEITNRLDTAVQEHRIPAIYKPVKSVPHLIHLAQQPELHPPP